MSISTHRPVFVDDYDAGIIYDGAWSGSMGLTTSAEILTDPGSRSTPFYGTLHTTEVYQSEYSFSYLFNGTNFNAFFVGGSGLEASPCKIDGVIQEMEPFNGGFTCQNKDALSSKEHNLTFTSHISNELVSFDGLFFTPTNVVDGGADQQYDLKVSLESAGDSFDLKFNGISAGVYVTSEFNSFGTVSTWFLSYSIDNIQHFNFTFVNPSQNAELDLITQLLIQTPPLSPSTHTLTVTLLKPEAFGVDQLYFDFAIVQGMARQFGLEVVPNISTSMPQSSPAAPTSSTISNPATTSIQISTIGRGRQVSHGAIAGIAIASFVAILTVFAIWRYVIQKQTAIAPDDNSTVLPFIPPNTTQTSRLIVSQHTPVSKVNRSHQAYGINRSTAEGQSRPQGEENIVIGPINRGRLVTNQYGEYTRSSKVANSEDGRSHEHEDEEDIISLPPIYNTLRRSLTNTEPSSMPQV